MKVIWWAPKKFIRINNTKIKKQLFTTSFNLFIYILTLQVKTYIFYIIFNYNFPFPTSNLME